jgi:hypothetical protein
MKATALVRDVTRQNIYLTNKLRNAAPNSKKNNRTWNSPYNQAA